ncbi:MAG: flagellar basal body L-ring protein FlgH [Alphaproteobacteria bacterium]|jgi:flagellar L-ring protein FlgH|nr:flagellar basal body L-ring protein FlgH [Alphaproteobacteria bacterium]
MKTRHMKPLIKIAAYALSVAVLGGCNTLERLSQVGEEPKLTRVQNPTHRTGYRPITMPMPAPIRAERAANSLWRAGSRAFFKDLRANQIGDIVTVTVAVADKVELDNSISRTRNNSETANLTNFLGYEQALDAIFPQTIVTPTLVNGASTSGVAGVGAIDREEKITTKVAAMVVQVLPNGNLVIEGRQETRVNAEVRELAITGIIRPQDITNSNTINYEQVAEARLAYGGRGTLTDVQSPRYGQQIYDILFPF